MNGDRGEKLRQRLRKERGETMGIMKLTEVSLREQPVSGEPHAIVEDNGQLVRVPFMDTTALRKDLTALEEEMRTISAGGATQAQIASAVQDYLDRHPIQGDGGITYQQIAALDSMFRVIAYDGTKDVATAYHQFKTAFGLSSGGDIGEITPDETPVTITYNLTNCSSSNKAVTSKVGASYYTSITPESGYSLGSIVVYMGGTNISQSVVSGGNINIGNITGNIVIAVNATANIGYTPELTDIYTSCTVKMFVGESETGETVLDRSSSASVITSMNAFNTDTFVTMRITNNTASSVPAAAPVFGECTKAVTANSSYINGINAIAPTRIEMGGSNAGNYISGETCEYTYRVHAGKYYIVAIAGNQKNSYTNVLSVEFEAKEV